MEVHSVTQKAAYDVRFELSEIIHAHKLPPRTHICYVNILYSSKLKELTDFYSYFPEQNSTLETMQTY